MPSLPDTHSPSAARVAAALAPRPSPAGVTPPHPHPHPHPNPDPQPQSQAQSPSSSPSPHDITQLATGALSFAVGAHPVAIVLDGRPCQVAAGSTLADLVAALGHAPQAVATAVDARHVPRSQRGARRLADGDAVLLFQPIVGG